MNNFKKGQSVRLKHNALQLHSRTIPAGVGFMASERGWRAVVSSLKNKVLTVSNSQGWAFPDSEYVCVDTERHGLVSIPVWMLNKVSYSLVHSWPRLCPSTDGLIGADSRELGVYDTMDEAQAAREEWYGLFDEDSGPCWEDGEIEILIWENESAGGE